MARALMLRRLAAALLVLTCVFAALMTLNAVMAQKIGYGPGLTPAGTFSLDTSGTITTTNTTASTSTTTGALVVGGGVGIAGKLYVGNTINLGAIQFVSSDASYTYIRNGSGTVDVILLGGTGDQTNYYDRATHKFRGPSGTGTPHLIVAQTTAPALTACGTGSPSIVGTDTAGTVTTGTSATGCVITFNVSYGAAPHCTVTWQSTPAASQSYTVAAGAITLTQTSASGRLVNYICVGS